MANKTLNAAKKAKDDEFYTQMADIQRELQHYWPHFRGRTVLCNCDDPYESNFFKYFALHFNHLGLKKLICTCYNGSPVQGRELLLHFEGFDKDPRKVAYKVEITEVRDQNGDGAVDISDVRYLLQNDRNVISILQSGDFRSKECVELLQQADVVVTNPPFSLFREYIAHLVKYDKSFLVLGNLNAIAYKDFFPLIKEDKVWLGFNNGAKTYVKPDGTERKMGNTVWYTNLDITKRHEKLDLVYHYSPKDYPEFDNYNMIKVPRIALIPCDYDGVMGVPISFVCHFNPEQFEIIGITEDNIELRPYWKQGCKKYDRPYYAGKRKYPALLIRNKQLQLK